MKHYNEILKIDLQPLTKADLIKIQGGGSSESLVDSNGWTWTYYYDDAGNLMSFQVTKVQCTSV